MSTTYLYAVQDSNGREVVSVMSEDTNAKAAMVDDKIFIESQADKTGDTSVYAEGVVYEGYFPPFALHKWDASATTSPPMESTPVETPATPVA